MYTIWTQLDDGTYEPITAHYQLDEAVQLAIELNRMKADRYVVRDALGKNVDLSVYSSPALS